MGRSKGTYSIVRKEYKYIELTQGYLSKVDSFNYDWLNQYSWSAHKYISTNKQNNGKILYYADRTIYVPETKRRYGQKMHQLIKGEKKNYFIDHQNHDTLDNTVDNLRYLTKSESAANRRIRCNNRSGFKGVSWHNYKWASRITINGITKALGHYDDLYLAVLAYDRAAVQYFGECACLNFPESYNQILADLIAEGIING